MYIVFYMYIKEKTREFYLLNKFYEGLQRKSNFMTNTTCKSVRTSRNTQAKNAIVFCHLILTHFEFSLVDIKYEKAKFAEKMEEESRHQIYYKRSDN